MGGVVHALNGTTSNFACAVSGTSPLTTSWELQTMKGEINRTGSIFSSLLTQNNEGIYMCVVVNEQEGLSDNAMVTVRVFGECTDSTFIHSFVHIILLSYKCTYICNIVIISEQGYGSTYTVY